MTEMPVPVTPDFPVLVERREMTSIGGVSIGKDGVWYVTIGPVHICLTREQAAEFEEALKKLRLQTMPARQED